MRYFLDCEFNGWQGELLSLALLRADGPMLYLLWDDTIAAVDPWVAENVIPILEDLPPGVEITRVKRSERSEAAYAIAAFLNGDHATIITDWPDDIRYFCESVITSPGYMPKNIPYLGFEMVRVDAYPTTLKDAVRHNAAWDTLALRELFKK